MSFHRALRLLATLVLTVELVPTAMAQSGGKGSSTGGKTTTTPTTATTPTQPNLNQVVMLSGKVIVQDGSPLPEPVAIERLCNGRLSREGRTDFKGYFTITLTQNPYAFSNYEGSAETSGMGGLPIMASAMSRLPQNSSTLAGALAGCELRGSLAGFRSSNVLIPLGDLGSGVGAVSVGTIVLERMGPAQGVTVSATGLNVPKDARKAYDRGHHAIENKKLPEAQQELEKAVQLYPRYAAAWLDLGRVYVQQNQLDKARNAF